MNTQIINLKNQIKILTAALLHEIRLKNYIHILTVLRQ
jgi:hypothetical protein